MEINTIDDSWTLDIVFYTFLSLFYKQKSSSHKIFFETSKLVSVQ